MIAAVAYSTAGRARQERRRTSGHPTRARRSVSAGGAAPRGRTVGGAGRRPARRRRRRRRRRTAPADDAWARAVDYVRARRRRRRRPVVDETIKPLRPPPRCRPRPAGRGPRRARRRPSGRLLRLVADGGGGDDHRDPRRRRDGGAAARPQVGRAGRRARRRHRRLRPPRRLPRRRLRDRAQRLGASGWGDEGDGYMPFTYLRTYATELCTTPPGGRAGAANRTVAGRPTADRPAAGLTPPAGGRAARRGRRRRSTGRPAAPTRGPR